jgi:hypothetical protein
VYNPHVNGPFCPSQLSLYDVYFYKLPLPHQLSTDIQSLSLSNNLYYVTIIFISLYISFHSNYTSIKWPPPVSCDHNLLFPWKVTFDRFDCTCKAMMDTGIVYLLTAGEGGGVCKNIHHIRTHIIQVIA